MVVSFGSSMQSLRNFRSFPFPKCTVKYQKPSMQSLRNFRSFPFPKCTVKYQKPSFNSADQKSLPLKTLSKSNTALLLYSFQIQHKVESVIERAKAQLTSSITIEENLRWRKPEKNSIKLNFDAAWNSTTKHGYLGWLIRDNAGLFIAGGAKGGGSYDSAKEADALREGLNYAKENGLKDLLCEGDAKGVMDQLRRRRHEDDIRTEVIIWDCLNLVQICTPIFWPLLGRLEQVTPLTAHQIAGMGKTHKVVTAR